MAEQKSAAPKEAPGDEKSPLTPEIIQQVTDKVYKLLRDDLQILRERHGLRGRTRKQR